MGHNEQIGIHKPPVFRCVQLTRNVIPTGSFSERDSRIMIIPTRLDWKRPRFNWRYVNIFGSLIKVDDFDMEDLHGFTAACHEFPEIGSSMWNSGPPFAWNLPSIRPVPSLRARRPVPHALPHPSHWGRRRQLEELRVGTQRGTWWMTNKHLEVWATDDRMMDDGWWGKIFPKKI